MNNYTTSMNNYIISDIFAPNNSLQSTFEVLLPDLFMVRKTKVAGNDLVLTIQQDIEGPLTLKKFNLLFDNNLVDTSHHYIDSYEVDTPWGLPQLWRTLVYLGTEVLITRFSLSTTN